MDDQLILLLCPGAIHPLRVQHYLPPMEALDVCSIFKVTRYTLPAFPFVLCNCAAQQVVLLNRSMQRDGLL